MSFVIYTFSVTKIVKFCIKLTKDLTHTVTRLSFPYCWSHLVTGSSSSVASPPRPLAFSCERTHTKKTKTTKTTLSESLGQLSVIFLVISLDSTHPLTDSSRPSQSKETSKARLLPPVWEFHVVDGVGQRSSFGFRQQQHQTSGYQR